MKTQTEKKTVYMAATLISGVQLGKESGLYVAVPEKGYKGHTFKIRHAYEKVGPTGETMYSIIEREVKDWLKADMFRRFPDKWGRGTYTLGYFKIADKL